MTPTENEKDSCAAHLPVSFCLAEDAAQDRKGGERKSRPSNGSACSDDSIATASTWLPDDHIVQLRTELSMRSAKLGELETEAAEMRSANDLLRRECQRSKCKVDLLLSENDHLRKECHDSNCKLQVEMSLRKLQCRKLQISNKRLRAECQDTKQHLKDAADLNASLQSKLQLALAETRLKGKRHLPRQPRRPSDDASTCVPEGDDLLDDSAASEDSAMSDATPGSSGSSRSSEDPETETTCSSRNAEAAAWEEKYRFIEAALHEARGQLASEQSRYAELDSEFGEASLAFRATSRQLASAKTRCAELESESSALEAEAEQLKSELELTQNQLELTRNQLSDLERVETQKHEPHEPCGAASPAVEAAEQDQPSLPETSATACSERPCVGAVEWDPYKLLLPELLPCLTVHDLLSWRVISKQTRSPKALIDHVAEMGRLDRPAAVAAFVNVSAESAGEHREFGINTSCAGDVKQQKYYGCRWWCLMLAHVRETHFPEADVRRIVGQNVRDLLGHCRNADESVHEAAQKVLLEYGRGSLAFVQRLIAEDLPGLMEELLSESPDISSDGFCRAVLCTNHLTSIVRSLSKLERRQWASLLVRILHPRLNPEWQRCILCCLRNLWQVDSDPRLTFAEAEEQLLAFRKTAGLSVAVQHLLFEILSIV